MKKLMILSLMVLVGISIAWGQTKGTKADQDVRAAHDVRKLEREWLDAGGNRDVAAIKRILADDFLITFGDSSTRDKAHVISNMLKNSAKTPNASEWTEDVRVRVHGNTAIITGRYLYKVNVKDKETISESRYTDTYIKIKGHWQIVASHLSEVKK